METKRAACFAACIAWGEVRERESVKGDKIRERGRSNVAQDMKARIAALSQSHCNLESLHRASRSVNLNALRTQPESHASH